MKNADDFTQRDIQPYGKCGFIPVNPMIQEWLGEKSYPNLKSVPEPIDMVDVFRRSELVPPVVDEAIEVGAKYIWMQDGVINPEAAAKAEAAGIPVIMDD